MVIRSPTVDPITQKYTYSGFAIDMWNQLCVKLGIKSTEYTEAESWAEFLNWTNGTHKYQSKYDIGISSTSVTAGRENNCDFTFPFYTTQLVPIVRNDMGIPLFQIALHVLTENSWLWGTVIGLGIIIAIIQYLLDKATSDSEDERQFHKFSDAAVWSAQTFVNAYPNTKFKSAWPKALGVIATITGAAVIAGFISLITSALNDKKKRAGILDPEDLRPFSLGVATQSTAEDYAKLRTLNSTSFTSDEDALWELTNNQVVKTSKTDVSRPPIQVVVADEVTAAYLVRTNTKIRATLNVIPINLQPQFYALALPRGSKLREPINIALLDWLHGLDYDATVLKYRLDDVL